MHTPDERLERMPASAPLAGATRRAAPTRLTPLAEPPPPMVAGTAPPAAAWRTVSIDDLRIDAVRRADAAHARVLAYLTLGALLPADVRVTLYWTATSASGVEVPCAQRMFAEASLHNGCYVFLAALPYRTVVGGEGWTVRVLPAADDARGTEWNAERTFSSAAPRERPADQGVGMPAAALGPVSRRGAPASAPTRASTIA